MFEENLFLFYSHNFRDSSNKDVRDDLWRFNYRSIFTKSKDRIYVYDFNDQASEVVRSQK